MIFETKRLYLREMSLEDFSIICTMMQDINVMYAWEHAFSDEEVCAWIERRLAGYRKNGYSYWLAVDKNSGVAVGQIGLLDEEINGQLHLGIGWILRRSHWGEGYALEGARGCVEYAFTKLNAPEIIADIRPENIASIKVAEKIGMTRCGQFDKIVNGKIMPHLIFHMHHPENL